MSGIKIIKAPRGLFLGAFCFLVCVALVLFSDEEFLHLNIIIQARSHHGRACIALFHLLRLISSLLLQRVQSGNQGGPKCNTRDLSWQLFLHVFLQGTSVAFSTWRLLNFVIPRKTCIFTLEFRCHSGGVGRTLPKKGVIEIIFLD